MTTTRLTAKNFIILSQAIKDWSAIPDHEYFKSWKDAEKYFSVATGFSVVTSNIKTAGSAFDLTNRDFVSGSKVGDNYLGRLAALEERVAALEELIS
jgi:hypothetical protein